MRRLRQIPESSCAGPGAPRGDRGSSCIAAVRWSPSQLRTFSHSRAERKLGLPSRAASMPSWYGSGPPGAIGDPDLHEGLTSSAEPFCLIVGQRSIIFRILDTSSIVPGMSYFSRQLTPFAAGRSSLRAMPSELHMLNESERLKHWSRGWWERNVCAKCPKHLDYPWESPRENLLPHSQTAATMSSNAARSSLPMRVPVILRAVRSTPSYAEAWQVGLRVWWR